jgi:hypothetical protein
MERAMTASRYLVISLFLLGSIPFGNERFGPTASAAEEKAKDMLAAQIRIQGFACNKPQRAVRDVKQSKPDHDVWILKCEGATYKISRYPDLAAKVELLR